MVGYSFQFETAKEIPSIIFIYIFFFFLYLYFEALFLYLQFDCDV